MRWDCLCSVTNNAEAAKSSGCTATTAITVTGPGTAPSGSVGKAPHFTRACARRASEADNPDKPGAGGNSKNQTSTVSATAKLHPVLVATRSSGRVIKRPRRDGSLPPSPPKKQGGRTLLCRELSLRFYYGSLVLMHYSVFPNL